MHQRRISVVVIAPQVQKRVSIDLVEFECRDLLLGGRAARSVQDQVINGAPLVGLEVVARRQRCGLDPAGVEMVEDVAERFQFMAQNIDSLKRPLQHYSSLSPGW